MVNDFASKALEIYNLEKVALFFNPIVKTLVEDVLGLYEDAYGKGSADDAFVLLVIGEIIKRHHDCTAFRARTDIDKDVKEQVIALLLSKILKDGTS